MEEAHGVAESMSKRLEQRKIMMLMVEPIILIELFTRLNRKLMRPDE